MPNYHKAASKPVSSLTTLVACCATKRSLRPFLKRRSVGFVAVLIVPDQQNLLEYTRAAELLMGYPEATVSLKGPQIAVESFEDKSDVVSSRMVSTGRFCPRTVLLFSSEVDIPAELNFAADVVIRMELPKPEHFLCAARRARIQGLTRDDAEFLVDQSWRMITSCFQKGRSARSAMRRLREFAERVQADAKLVSTEIKPDKSGPSLHELKGFGEAKDWALDLAQDLDDQREGRIAWEEIDRGMLLSGPPGCGKTTFATALAETLKLPIVIASGARWQANGHLGDMLKAMRASFEQAARLAPSILFIDEFDTFSQRVDSGEEYNDKYHRQVVNGLLECLDGAQRRQGVIVVGATNFPDAIDDALLRPGRLDRHIVIPLPDAKARCAILEHHLKTSLEIFNDFPRHSVGMTGADIERVARDAKRAARRAGVSVSIDHVKAAMPAREDLSNELMKFVAVHEVGHALVGVILDCGTLRMLSIESSAVVEGGREPLGFASFLRPPREPRRRQTFVDQITMLLGGIAAEEVVFGSFSEGAGGVAGADLNVATDLATAMEGQLGMGVSLISELSDGKLERLRASDRDLRKRVDDLLKAEFARAKQIVRDNTVVYEELVALLLKRKMLSGQDVVHMINASRGIGSPQRAAG